MDLEAQTQARCLVEHVASSQPRAVPHEIFDQAVRLACPDGTHKSLLALFENRVTIRAIRHWRKGRRRPPEWAKERLRKVLGAQRDYLQKLHDGIDKEKARPKYEASSKYPKRV